MIDTGRLGGILLFCVIVTVARLLFALLKLSLQKTTSRGIKFHNHRWGNYLIAAIFSVLAIAFIGLFCSLPQLSIQHKQENMFELRKELFSLSKKYYFYSSNSESSFSEVELPQIPLRPNINNFRPLEYYTKGRFY